MNNTIVLIGRLAHSPELRYTNSNKAVVNTTIAVRRDYRNSDGDYETDFVDIQMWGNTAKTLSEYCEEGDLIGVKGSLRVEFYQDKDGNNKKKIYVFVDKISFLQSKQKKEKKEEIEKEETTFENDPFAEYGEQIGIDDNFLD